MLLVVGLSVPSLPSGPAPEGADLEGETSLDVLLNGYYFQSPLQPHQHRSGNTKGLGKASQYNEGLTEITAVL